jgi:hypothetical protein
VVAGRLRGLDWFALIARRCFVLDGNTAGGSAASGRVRGGCLGAGRLRG